MSEELEHSERGPSGASKWRRCAGSIEAERGRPDKKRREAAEGTVFHHYAALALELGLEPDAFPMGKVREVDGFEIAYDPDMAFYMRNGLEWLAERIEPGDIVIVERKVDISPWAGPGQFGTSDVCVIRVRGRQIIVFDWKYGKGVPVDPIKNDQCYLYGLGCWNTFAKALFVGVDPADIEVIFHIEQPRTTSGGGTWRTTMAEVLAEGIEIREDAEATMVPGAPRTPGEKQCAFCRASGDCREQMEWNLNLLGNRLDRYEEKIELTGDTTLRLPDPATVPLEVRSAILLNKSAILKYVKAIAERTMHDFRHGLEVPLIKAVPGKAGRRMYRESAIEQAKAAVVKAVGEEKAFETKLIAPAALEKLIGKPQTKKVIGDYVVQAPGKPILVPLHDKREAILDYASMLDEIDDDNEDEE